jgi:hypothetical protein
MEHELASLQIFAGAGPHTSGTREAKFLCTEEDETHSEIILSAHIDSAGTPGAEDNASGVAVLLELARTLPGLLPARASRWRRPTLTISLELGSLLSESVESVTYKK